MILIADSGSTKTDWRALLPDGRVRSCSTAGINPVFKSRREIADMVSERVLPSVGGDVDAIRFYGAGVVSKEVADGVCAALGDVFPKADCRAESDLLGAARSLCGTSAGIACIIGTGSNSCLYDGTSVVRNVRAGGFILGDEASGAWFGRRLLSDFVKGLLPPALEKELSGHYALDYPTIVSKVYKEPAPSRFLASFMPMLREFSNHPYVKRLLAEGFETFLLRNVCSYDGYRGYEINFTGSVAFHFREELLKALSSGRMKAGRIVATPIEGLVEYHKREL